MPGSTVTISQSSSVTTGRLNHVHYVPLYNAHRLRRKQRQLLEKELSSLQKFKLPPLPTKERPEGEARPQKSARSRLLEELLQTQTFEVPSSYTGVRPPLLPKISKQQYPETSIEQRRRERLEHFEAQRERISAFLAEQKISMASESTSRIREVNGMLRLPQIMKSFIPTENRKLPPKPHPEHKSSWIDLTGSRSMKQVAPNGYRKSTFDIAVQPVTLITVDSDRTQAKLQRKPLPPVRNTTPQKTIPNSKTSLVWHPADSQSKLGDVRGNQAQQHQRSSAVKSPRTEAGKKLLDTLGQRLNQARKQNILRPTASKMAPSTHNSSNYFWESGKLKPKLNIRKRQESDRHFGNLTNGVVFNNLPSDLIGSYRATFQSLSYYLGKGEMSRKAHESDEENDVVYIPTGRLGETIEEETEVDEDAMNPEFIRSITNNPERFNSFKMRYVHRDSSDTPSMDRMPWEENGLDGATEAELDARNAAMAAKRRSGSQKVKQLTVKLPQLPLVPQVERRLRAPPATPVDAKLPAVAPPVEQCGYCNMQETARVQQLPAISLPASLTTQELGKELFSKENGTGSHWYGVKPITSDEVTTIKKGLKKTSSGSADEETTKPNRTEQLIVAHGELKRRRHQCSQKEVLITPFTVKIDENGTSRKAADFHPTISKPYTFSYMNANRKRSRDALPANQLSNVSEKQSKNKTLNAESWYVTNFVAVDPTKREMTSSQEASHDLVNEAKTVDSSSRDRATSPKQETVAKKGSDRKRTRVKLVPQNPERQNPQDRRDMRGT